MSAILEAIRAVDPQGAWAPFLEDNVAEFVGLPDGMLTDAWVAENRAWGGLALETEAELLETARAIRENPTLSALFFHCHRLLYVFPALYPDAEIAKWPSVDPLLPGKNGLFLLLLALTAVPAVRKTHAVQGVPLEVTRDTCGDIASRVAISREFSGKLGVAFTCVRWLRLHVKGDLFQFGRLQFHVMLFGDSVRVYRRLADGEVLVLAAPGQRFTAEGFYDGAGGAFHRDAWFSEWKEENGRLTANRIHPRGRAIRKPVTLDLKEWRLTLDAASAVLNTHIPRGPKITLDDWKDSIRRGFAFFEAFRPASASPAACVCRSWMFDARLQDLLPDSSGMVALQKRLTLFPYCASGGRAGLTFIFGDQNIDLDKAPRDTSLRRALIDHLKAGGVFTGGGMLVFKDQLDQVFA